MMFRDIDRRGLYQLCDLTALQLNTIHHALERFIDAMEDTKALIGLNKLLESELIEAKKIYEIISRPG